MKKRHNLNKSLGYISVILPLPIVIGFSLFMLYLAGILASQMGLINSKPNFQISLGNTEQLPATGSKTKKLSKTFTHPSFGYSFKYSESELLNESPISEIFIFSERDQKGEVIYIDNLKIKTFYSDKTLDIDFDEGLMRQDYKKPQKLDIGEQEFFLIITKEGYIRYIVKEYKYLDDTLWVKLDKQADGTKSNYYISFLSTEDQSFPLTDVSRIKDTLKSFNF